MRKLAGAPPRTGEAAAEGFSADLLVVGGGMAGMSAAGYAADRGATVVVLEKGPGLGGSAVLSSGSIWTAETLEVARKVNPEGDQLLVEKLISGYPEAVSWVAGTGVTMTDRVSLTSVMGFPAYGYTIDVIGYMRRCQSRVEKAGGAVVLNCTPSRLLVEDGAVVGAIASDRDGDIEVRAPWTLFASGGFQNDAELRERHLGPGGAQMLVRSNPNSDGAALRLTEGLDVALSAHMEGFYGHTMAAPLSRPLEPRDYIRLAQLHSTRSVLLDKSGKRFVDESVAYHHNARAISRLPGQRAVLVADRVIVDEDRAGYGIMEQIDRPAEARAEGARATAQESLAALAREVSRWGYDDIQPAVAEFNSLVASDARLDPPRGGNRRALSQPPFFALEVQPAVTFTMGGPLIDPDARVLAADGNPVPGLLAAGADAGGLYHEAYLGGLSMALVFGLQAACTATGTSPRP